jgi:hypothetical protein
MTCTILSHPPFAHLTLIVCAEAELRDEIVLLDEEDVMRECVGVKEALDISGVGEMGQAVWMPFWGARDRIAGWFGG